MKMTGQDKGFSLVELLVVVALIGVILLISVPAIIKQMSHQRLVRTARDLFTEINAARVNAIVRNTNYEVDVNGSVVQLKYYDSGTAAYVNEPAHATASVQAGVSITAPAANFVVLYKPNGTVTVPGDICIVNSRDTTDKFSIVFSGTLGKISIVTGC